MENLVFNLFKKITYFQLFQVAGQANIRARPLEKSDTTLYANSVEFHSESVNEWMNEDAQLEKNEITAHK